MKRYKVGGIPYLKLYTSTIKFIETARRPLFWGFATGFYVVYLFSINFRQNLGNFLLTIFGA